MNCPGCDAENPALASFCCACGARLTSLAQGKARSKSASGSGGPTEADEAPVAAKLGLVETAPFEESPLTGADNLVHAKNGRLGEESPAALSDTLIDMSPEAVAALTRLAASANDGGARADDRGDRLKTPLDVTQDAPADLGVAVEVSKALSVDRADEGPTSASFGGGETALGESRPEKASWPSPGSEPSWSGSGAGSGAMGVGADDFDFELRRAKRVTLAQRSLLVFIALCLAAAAYFVWSGIRAMRGSEVRGSPVKVGAVTPEAPAGSAPRTKAERRAVGILLTRARAL